MTNEEKRLYIKTMAEYNRQCYNNGETDNFIGMIESKFYQYCLKLALSIKYRPINIKKRTGSPVPHYKQQGDK